VGRPNPAVVCLFLSLARRGIRSAILSNTPRDIWQLLAGRHEWMSAADITTLSFAVGNAKPERSIFVRCLSDLDVAPSQALFIDDRPENVEAAKALGLRALHYRTPQDLERWVTDALCER
jgi:putative hydrolase of the HAD superfamily